MSAKHFNIRKYDDSIDFSTLLELYNSMSNYLNPIAVEVSEEYAKIILSSNPNFKQNSLIFENAEKEIIGFASIIQLPFYKDEWFVLYGIMLEYLDSRLPGELIGAILNHGRKQNIPELYIQTSGDLSASFDDKLETLGFKPIHYYFSMTLDDYDQFSPPDHPQGFDIHIKEEIEDFKSVVRVINEAFKDSFLWSEVRPRKWKKLNEKFKKNYIVGYGIAYDKNEEIVGFCQYYFNPSQADIGFINTLSVHPNYHHRGIGNALFASGVEFLRDNGCKIINLPVDAKNEKALKMYEKFGFYVKKNLTEKTYRLI